MQTAFYLAMALVLWVGGHRVATGIITIGQLTQFLAFMTILQLPVRQIGRFLFNSTLSEELPHDIDSVKDDCCKWAVPPVHPYDGSAPGLESNAFIGAYIHYAAALPANHSGDIQTPPPNC